MKLMVVDRSPLAGQAIEHIVSKHCTNLTFVGQAFSGKESLALAKRTEPNIVFTDILIPGTDGLVMARKLLELFPEILIVILTASDDFCSVEKALRMGIKDYLLKPISQNDFLKTIDKLIFAESNSQSPQRLPTSMLFQHNEFLQIIRTGSMQQLYQHTDDFLGRILDNTHGDLNEIRTQLISLASEIISSEPNSSISGFINVIYRHFLCNIISTQNKESLFSPFKEFIEKTASIYNQNNNSYSFEIISRIQEIIELRLHTNITLESIANEMFFSTSYLSRLFKKQTGKNFSDYLIDRRLERAKLLLLSTNRTINSIAQEIGYDNSNSFRRLFKNKVGQSATKYRCSRPKEKIL